MFLICFFWWWAIWITLATIFGEKAQIPILFAALNAGLYALAIGVTISHFKLFLISLAEKRSPPKEGPKQNPA